MTYEQALKTFRDVVNLNFPLELGGRRTRRQINEISGRGGRGGRGGGGRRGSQGERGGLGGRRRAKHTREDSTMITLTDGRKNKYHPLVSFTGDIYAKMKQEDKDNLRTQCIEYKRQRKVQATNNYPNHNDHNQNQN